jgi:hypothetical protein
MLTVEAMLPGLVVLTAEAVLTGKELNGGNDSSIIPLVFAIMPKSSSIFCLGRILHCN